MTLLMGCAATDVAYMPSIVPPPSPSEAVLYLVGDAGEDSPGRARVLRHLARDLRETEVRGADTPVLVAFLGDNIYDVGAREDFKVDDLSHLTAQVDALRDAPGARGVFLPGNHDWAKGAADALARAALQVQQEWLHEIAPDSMAVMLPGDACPGPARVDLAVDVHVLFLDTEWLLRQPDDECGGIDAFYERLESELTSLRGSRVILAAHHPLATGGPHGGNVAPFAYGPGVYYLAVKGGLGIQDLGAPRYATMIRRLREAIASSGTVPVAFVAGHDHSLQVIGMSGPGAPLFQLVSGSASKSSAVRRIDGTRYAAGTHGYMRLDFGARRTRVTVFAGTGGDGEIGPVFSCALATEAGVAACQEARVVGDLR